MLRDLPTMHPSTLHAPLPPPLRDPIALLHRVRQEWHRQASDLWVFGYASLIWRPEIEPAERRAAWVHGWHRALRMRSRVNRGTPDNPGLVFALLRGGSCHGMAYRIARRRADDELTRLWWREMPTGVYDPRWVRCRTVSGMVTALAFTLSQQSPNHTGPITDAEMLDILHRAQGRFGTTLDYLLQTALALRACQVHDAEIERLVRLARRHGLTP